MGTLFMKKKNTKKKKKKGKFVTKNTYQLMFGNEPPMFIRTTTKYMQTRANRPLLNGRQIIINN